MGKTRPAQRKKLTPKGPRPVRKAEPSMVETMLWLFLQATALIVVFFVAIIAYIYFAPNIGKVSDSDDLDSFFWSQPDKPLFDESTVTYEKVGLLEVATAGPRDGPMLVLLHGFPETAVLAWYPQIEYFSKQGYFVVAPDQRGYNKSEKPSAVLDYRLDYLADDIVKVIDHYDREKAVVAGHDWGGAVAWHIATVHEEKLEKLIIINLPHPAVFTEHLRTFKQLCNSWYIFFFQTPWVPEAKIYKDSFRWLTGVFSMSPPGTFSRELILKYHEAWSQPGAVTGMLNWYRAAIRSLIFLPKPEPKMISVPTLMIWGDQDRALDASMAAPSMEWCENGELVMLPGVSHWVQHEAGDRVNSIMHAFIR